MIKFGAGIGAPTLLNCTLLCALHFLGMSYCWAQSPRTTAAAGGESATQAEPLDPDAMTAELKRIEQICRQVGLNLQVEAEITARWSVQTGFDETALFLPVPFADDKNKSSMTPARAAWLKHFRTARERHAEYWFRAAGEAAKNNDEWNAYRLLWRTLRENPEHVGAKAALGPLVTALTVKSKPRNSNIPHGEFGWPPGSYQRMDSTNFEITSRAVPDETREIAEQLERLQVLWSQVFFPLWAPPGIVTQRLNGKNMSWQPRREMKVVLLKNRDDYLATLGVKEENIGVSVGYYHPDERLSFFYPDQDLAATLHHEATHQLLAQATRVGAKSGAGGDHDYWLLEGSALYMESLTDRGTYWTIGGWMSPRLQAARFRALHDGFWVDWDKFTDGGMEAWKKDPEVSLLYTQAAAMTHLFMDHSYSDEEADYETARAAYIRSLTSVYQLQRPDTGMKKTLDARSDVVLSELPLKKPASQEGSAEQRAYVNFLLVRDQHLDQVDIHADPKELVLTRSHLEPNSWAKLKQFLSLTRLDVSYSNIAAADMTWLKSMRRLQRLSLEGTGISEETVRDAASLPDLVELDLTDCAVEDSWLEPLRGNKKLTTLWLSRTKVTSSTLPLLDSIKTLEFVVVDGTAISPTDWQDFIKTHPKLQSPKQ